MINADALAYMRGRALAGPVIRLLAEHAEKYFADEAAWQAHLDRLGITTLRVSPDPVQIATEGALWGSLRAHGLVNNTVILSKPAPAKVGDVGQFDVGRHALSWVHSERLVHSSTPSPSRNARHSSGCAI